jgi:GTP cyclohydrolase I
MAILDIQSGGDTRAMPINAVGVRALRLPILLNEEGASRHSVGEWSVSTDLPADRRGTHMSRLVRALHDAAESFNYDSFCELPALLMRRLSASSCHVSVVFPYFILKAAPVSGEKGYLDAQARFVASQSPAGLRRLAQVTSPVTSLCPCSKAISEYGAHNQRSHVTLAVEPRGKMRAQDLIALAEEGASSDLFSVLKRADERHVTEKAYNNPKFVEDIARDLAVALANSPDFLNYRVEAENFESIHNHSAYAIIQSPNFPAFLL